MSGCSRNGELIDHKVKADEAVKPPRRWRRAPRCSSGGARPTKYASRSLMVQDRDFFVDEALANHRGALVDPVSMPAEALLFQMYTSGTTGHPEGGHHGHLPTWIRE